MGTPLPAKMLKEGSFVDISTVTPVCITPKRREPLATCDPLRSVQKTTVNRLHESVDMRAAA